MLRKDCFQLPDFFAQSLTFNECALQSGSKIVLILHESALCNNGKDSGMFWIDYREPLQPGNFTKYRIGGNKMIHQFLIPQFECHGKLKSVKRTET